MEYKHLLDICEQLLKYSALPLEMLEKYYLLKEKTLSNRSHFVDHQLPLKLIQLFSGCFNSMLTHRDINITSTEAQISHLLDQQDAPDLRAELSKSFQLLLQINSDRKEQDATAAFLQGEIRKLKLELNIANSKLEQQRKVQNSEEKDRVYKLTRQVEQLQEELQTKIEEHEEQLNQVQFKYEEQLKTLQRKNKEHSASKQEAPGPSLREYEKFFDLFAEQSLPYLEKYEQEFERFQSKNKKYNEQVSENEILLDFLFFLLQKYVPLHERKSSAKKSQPSPRSLHFDQYKPSATNLDDTYTKLKQELEQSKRTLEKYELSKQRLQSLV